MMEQYAQIKSEHSNRILLYHIGEFYEIFYSDAEVVSELIGITLTSRKWGGKVIPMCGIPCKALDQCIIKLVAKGFPVAVCDQVKNSATSKSIMQRQVVRIVTKGTVVEPELLTGFRSNYIACINDNLDALAWADISTGQFKVIEGHESLSQLHIIEPSEVIVANSLEKDLPLGAVQTIDPSLFVDSIPVIKKRFGHGKIEGASKNGLLVCGALLSYLNQIEKGVSTLLAHPTLVNRGKRMFIDKFTNSALELDSGYKKDKTLFNLLNKTLTWGGARLLYSFLKEPLLDKKEIDQRLMRVEFFLNRHKLVTQVRKILKSLPDIERILGRVHFRRTNPQELGRLRDGLKTVSKLHLICGIDIVSSTGVSLHGDLIDILVRSLKKNDLPHSHREGGFISSGYNRRLDKLRSTVEEYRKKITALFHQYRKSVSELKICYLPTIGFCFEVPSSIAPSLSNKFVHKQSLKDKSRYITKELMELEFKLVQVEKMATDLESVLFEEIQARIEQESTLILDTVKAASHIDLFSSWSILAKESHYTKPVVSEEGNLKLINCFHPMLQRFSQAEIKSNSCDLSLNRIILLTGANMSGKSTFSRQVALMVIISQVGCFVPAEFAEVGLVDRVFCRSGCCDDVVNGCSSFMNEMKSLSNILNNITRRSLVVLDEVGSGTSSKEGAALLQATLEYIHAIGCRCICNTHYFELTKLDRNLSGLKNWRMNEEHEIAEGVGTFSHAIKTAQVAGIPDSIVNRAEELLLSQ